MRQFWLTMLALTLAHTTALAVERPDFSPPVGEQMDLSAQLTDEVGETESLAQFARGRPAVIMFGYHNCPNLCGVSQQVVAEALSGTGLEADSYSPLFITLTSSESPSDALGAKQRLAEAQPQTKHLDCGHGADRCHEQADKHYGWQDHRRLQSPCPRGFLATAARLRVAEATPRSMCAVGSVASRG